MLKGKERQMVLDYLYQECVVASQVPSEVLKKSGCMIEAKMKYEKMSEKERIGIYVKLLEKKIINYLIENVSNSLAMEWTNGSPQKREMRIYEWAQNKYKNISKSEKIAICEILNIKYLSN